MEPTLKVSSILELCVEYTVGTDKAKLNIDVIHSFLTASYWAKGIPRAVVEKCVANSLCFGVYHGDEQIGFARIFMNSSN